ncbi:helix-turn-helix domain-containing protein [Massilia sp. CF038]|uniref:helix-turn-helix domain-containing protein n=1 Tax=Massilia sp. CF038 TaxID=1881045 RepID=UPI00091CC9C2|nr:helix-turn-helix transcriptional regulator [Massilia sp. CF038]SHH19103.1 Helix-turn-helix [Massilia sp. CF038]
MNTPTSASAAPRDYFSDFPEALRYWRGKRGYSQLQLSTLGAVSQRHLSFLESGRAQPSKDLILKLGIALDIPLRQRNVMLLAAGFAPAYRERDLADPELGPVRTALDFMLAQQAPYPALVVDRLWNLRMCNPPAAGLFCWLLDLPAGTPIALDGSLNVLRLMLDPNGVRPYLSNWREVAGDLLQWIAREALGDGPGSQASQLLAELAAMAGSAANDAASGNEHPALPFLPVGISKNQVALNLFTTISTLGTPRDVTLHELRVETFFPADEETAAWFKARASSPLA